MKIGSYLKQPGDGDNPETSLKRPGDDDDDDKLTPQIDLIPLSVTEPWESDKCLRWVQLLLMAARSLK